MNIKTLLSNASIRKKIPFIAAFGILCFHLLFRPFQMAFYELDDLLLVNAAYFVISVLILSLSSIVIPHYFPNHYLFFLKNRKRFFGFVSIIITLLGIGFFSFKIAAGFYTFSSARIATGVLAIVGFILFSGSFFLTNLFISKSKTKEIIDVPKDRIQVEHLEIFIQDLFYVSSEKNYVIWNFIKEGKLEHFKTRATLKEVNNLLSHFPDMVQFHRAFLVNKSKIQSIKKVENTKQIHFFGYDKTIPVSKTYLKNISPS